MTLNLFFISIDIVGSSNPAIPIDIQAEKIRKVLELVKKIANIPRLLLNHLLEMAYFFLLKIQDRH